MLTRPSRPPGTAPEYAFAGTAYGPPVDVWAIGCVVAELITGEARAASHSSPALFGWGETGDGRPDAPVQPCSLLRVQVFFGRPLGQLDLLRLCTERLGTVPPHLASGHVGGIGGQKAPLAAAPPP